MEISKQNYLAHLNKNQKEAIIDLEGPCLIVAGAGSGKTRVLTSRVVHIIKEKKAWPNQILCVTFTNKAAREMQNRIASLLKEKQTSIPWLGTFHSVSAKLLRRHAEAVGLNSRFTIIDQEDQLRLIKNICKAENIDIKKIAPQFILTFINQWKNKGLLPKNVVVKKGLPNLERHIKNIKKFGLEVTVAINHFISYFYVSILGLCLYLRNHNFKKLVYSLFFLSIILEVLQLIVPNRTFEIYDVSANFIGVLVAYCLIKIYKSWSKS